MKNEYDIEDILVIYRKYFLPTLKEKFPARMRVEKTTISICKSLKYPMISEKPLKLGEDTFNKVKECFINRNIQFNNQNEFFDSDKASEILNVSKEVFKCIDRKNNLRKATVIRNTYFYYKEDIYGLLNKKKNLYSPSELSQIIKDKLNMNLSRGTIRNYMKMINYEKYSKSDKTLLFLEKGDLNNLLELISNKYKPRELKRYPKYINLILDNGDYEFVLNKKKGMISLKEIYLENKMNIEYKSFNDYRKNIIKYCLDKKIKFYILKTNLNRSYTVLLEIDDAEIIFKRYNSYFIFENGKKKEVKIRDKDDFFKIGVLHKNIVSNILTVSSIERIKQCLPYYMYCDEIYFDKKMIKEIKSIRSKLITVNSVARIFSKNIASIRSIMNSKGIDIYLYRGVLQVLEVDSILNENFKIIEECLNERRYFEQIENNYDLYDYLISKCKVNNNLEKTYETFEEFRMYRMKKNKRRGIVITLSKVYRYISENFKKEINLFTDKDIELLISSLNEATLTSEFIRFIEYNKKNRCLYEGAYKEKKIEKKQLSAYSKSQWIKFGKIIFGLDKERYDIMLKKSIEVRGNACIWLYCALHYVSSCRKSDYEGFPGPDLKLFDYDLITLKEMMKNKEFTLEMAQKAVNSVKLQIDYNDQKPIKTGKRNRVPIKFEVGTSYVYIIGMLLTLCEIHRLESNCKVKNSRKKLLSATADTVKQHYKFFGDIYYDIFGISGFTNLRGNKTYEKNIVIKSNNNGWGIGVQLASIARSHKLNKELFSRSTEVYLKDVNKDGDVDNIMLGIFERGTFGFIPYQLLILLKGENFRNLDIFNQNKFLSNLSLTPFEVEAIVKISEDNINKYDNLFKEISNLTDDQVKNILKKICYGLATSKLENCQCLLKAINKKCNQIGVNSCISCNYSIPEIYILSKINRIINEILNKIIIENNEFEIKKNTYLLINVYMKILNNAIIVLGKDRVNSFINVDELGKKISKMIREKKILMGI